MNTQVEETTAQADVKVASRLTVILHPNTSCIDIALNDRVFNRERYSSLREQEPEGAEKELLDFCGDEVIGVEKAEASRNVLRLAVGDGVMLREFIPQVIAAVRRWGSSSGDDYSPEIFVDNRRYEVEPSYDEDRWATSGGVREHPMQADIGMSYTAWPRGT